MKNKLASLWEILLVSTKLGLTSFGGPIAHLGYFRDEYVIKRKWMDEDSYAQLVALCQFIPGPASSQVGIGIGMVRAGWLGGIISFIGFTFPSVLALILFALTLQSFNQFDLGWIQGLKIVAVAVVAQAVMGMAKNLAPDFPRKTITLLAVVTAVLWQTTMTQILIIIIAGIIGFFVYKNVTEHKETSLHVPVSKKFALLSLVMFFAILVLLPIINQIFTAEWITVFDRFYRSGALVFGGGHVVLPLLEMEFVPSGFLSEEAFLAGYGAAQAVPGPLFTFAAYLGTIINGWQGGLLATFAIFLPAFLLIAGTLPFWQQISKNKNMKAALYGVNAAVVGILIAALYDPIWTSTIHTAADFSLAAILFFMLNYWKLPPWIVVVTGAAAGALMHML
ncbi:chromate efflux transporter [Cytobacillus gottheilii]|uniref:chromate efflux transporter n=1 Tax=Cytobacillus gottheilii TaxID=859144 RepID=UPI0008369DE1|nr:chromate efflux transporter [Cytobacillus gottheilii]